jgi:hypothetical protein
MSFPTTEANVATAERNLSVSLPREYRERLISINGGELSTGGDSWVVFPVADSAQLPSKRTKDIVTETRMARNLQGFPDGAVAIASNADGDFLVFVPKDNLKHLDPQVQLWSRETHQCKSVPLRYDD